MLTRNGKWTEHLAEGTPASGFGATAPRFRKFRQNMLAEAFRKSCRSSRHVKRVEVKMILVINIITTGQSLGGTRALALTKQAKLPS